MPLCSQYSQPHCWESTEWRKTLVVWISEWEFVSKFTTNMKMLIFPIFFSHTIRDESCIITSVLLVSAHCYVALYVQSNRIMSFAVRMQQAMRLAYMQRQLHNSCLQLCKKCVSSACRWVSSAKLFSEMLLLQGRCSCTVRYTMNEGWMEVIVIVTFSSISCKNATFYNSDDWWPDRVKLRLFLQSQNGNTVLV